ncbi:hypothetical protein F8388_007741 [Cannabis sativa]|uniref:Myb/SANT-like domain-containing protein n=1 Tax=Cannabis sativa TaxID=3483 RepID=A0A7J6FT28_CANSA|nr:hypothetical protein F8388_007741 [Cannabis sativa]
MNFIISNPIGESFQNVVFVKASLLSSTQTFFYFSQMASRVTRSKSEQSQQHQPQEQQNRAKWTSFLTKILADLMVEQVYKGNRQNNYFVKKSWEHMCDGFYRKTGLKWDKDQLKSRYAVLRKQYATLKSLLGRGGFTWDETTGTITASEKAWTEIIKELPDAESLKTSGCPIYKKLCTIFSESVTNGKHDQLAEVGEKTPSKINQTTPLSLQQQSSSESEEADDVTENQDKGQQPSTPMTGTTRKRGRKGIDDAIAEAILEMATASKMRTTAIQQLNAAKYSVTKCIKLLDEMQGVDEKLYLAALEMFNKPLAREIFLSLRGDKRLTWLHRKVLGEAHLPY